MADVTKTIAILFEAVDNTGSALTSIGAGITSLSGKVEDVTEPFKDLAGAIIATDLAIAGLGVAMLALSTKEAAAFNAALREINTLVGLTPEELKKYGDDIRDYATTSTSSFRDIEGSIYDMISAGVPYEESLKALNEAEKLAVAGKSSLKEAVTLLVPTINAYGEDMDEAGRYSDVFFTAVKLGVTTVPALSTAMGGLSPIAAAAGVPIGTVAAAIATLTSNGMETPQAATALKAALSNIIQPSNEAAEAAKELGIEFGESALRTEGLEGVIKTLMTATGGSVTEMGRFFGSVEGLAGALSLGSGEATKFVGNIEAMKGSTGATTTAFEEMQGSFDNVATTLDNNVKAVLQRIGEEMLPGVTTIMQEIIRVYQSIGEGFDKGAFDEPMGIVKAFLGDIEGVLKTAADNLPEALADLDWTKLSDAFDRLRGAFENLFDGVDLSTPDGLRAALQWFIDSGSLLISATGGIVNSFKPMAELILGAAQRLSEFGNDSAETAGKVIGFGTQINLVAGFIGSFGGFLSSAGTALEIFATASLVKAVTGLVGPAGLSGALTTAGGALNLFGPAIAAVATALASFEFGKWISEATGFREASERWLLSLKGIPEVVGPGEDALRRTQTTLGELGQKLGETEFTMKDFNKAVEDGRLVWSEATGQWVTVTEKADELRKKFDETKLTTGDLVASFNKLSGETGLLIDEQGKVVQSVDKQRESLTALEPLYTNIINETFRWQGGVLGIVDEFGKWTEATDEQKKEFESLGESYRDIYEWRDGTLMVKDATGQWTIATNAQKEAYWNTVEAVNAIEPAVNKQTEAVKQQAAEQAILNRATTEYLLGWEKIKSDERVAVYEIRSNVEIARIEADAERVVAAYDSIARSFENTGEVLQGLFDIWSGADRISDRDKIEDWIRREYEIREKLADAQVGLIDAEIRRINAQTAMLARGGMDVRITSDGLEPALESFMFQVIDKVRLTVAGSYEEFLVGCGGGA